MEKEKEYLNSENKIHFYIYVIYITELCIKHI